MTRSPLATIVLTVHNRADRVRRTLLSLSAQTHRPLQIVVVDNGSSDASPEVCRTWREEMLHAEAACGLSIDLIDEPQGGACRARNAGLRAARGEWVSFFDDDDEMSPRFIEQMLAAAARQPAAQWVLTRTRMVLPDGRERIRSGWARPRTIDHLLGSFVSTQSFVARRDLLLRLGGWDESIACWNDYELGARLLTAAQDPAWEKHVHHRIYQHGASITSMPLEAKTEAIAHTLDTLFRLPQLADRAARRALFFKREIACGELRRKGRADLARRLSLATAPLTRSVVPAVRWAGRLLQSYVAAGGRGAWRIALPMA